jgi:hypothetical protein
MHIINVDRTKPIGAIAGDYGDYRYNKGLITGIIT